MQKKRLLVAVSFLYSFLFRHLGNYHSRKDQSAADQLGGGHTFFQQPPAAESSKNLGVMLQKLVILTTMTGAPCLYYGTEIAMQGVAVSLVDLPGTDFETDADTLYSVGNYGVMVQNILKGDNEDADRAIMDIYAASYVKLKDGSVLTSAENVAYSLFDVLMLLKEQDLAKYEALIQMWQK